MYDYHGSPQGKRWRILHLRNAWNTRLINGSNDFEYLYYCIRGQAEEYDLC